jgi:hypothetical protein
VPHHNPATEALLRAESAAANDPRRDRSKPAAPFAIRDLSVLAYANGFTLWHYKLARIADVLSPNFFRDAADMMAAGDHVHVSAPEGGAVLAVTHVDEAAVAVKVLRG